MLGQGKSGSEQTAQHFEFDKFGRRKRYRLQLKPQPKFSCCFACLLLIISLILLTFGILLVLLAIITRNLDFSSANATLVSFPNPGGLDEFYENWKAPPEVHENARVFEDHDKENRPVWFLDFGQWNLAPLLENNETKQELDLFIEQLHYRFRQTVTRDRNATRGWGMVVNMDEWTLGKAFDLSVVGYLQDKLKLYMEILKTFKYAFLINIPSWSRFVIEMLRPFWGDTLDRFEIFGHEDWLPALRDRISKDQLPPGFAAYFTDEEGDDEDSWWLLR